MGGLFIYLFIYNNLKSIYDPGSYSVGLRSLRGHVAYFELRIPLAFGATAHLFSRAGGEGPLVKCDGGGG